MSAQLNQSAINSIMKSNETEIQFSLFISLIDCWMNDWAEANTHFMLCFKFHYLIAGCWFACWLLNLPELINWMRIEDIQSNSLIISIQQASNQLSRNDSNFINSIKLNCN